MFKAPTSCQGSQADVVSLSKDLNFCQSCIAALFISGDADQPHHLEILLGIQINVSICIEHPRGIQRTAQQRNRNASLSVGLGRLENLAIAKHVVLGLDPGTLSDKDAELPQGPSALFVGEYQLDLSRQHRPSQVDVDRPIDELVCYIGLPIGRWIAINELGSVRLIATGTPYSSLDLAALLRRMGEKVCIEGGIDLLAELLQLQRAVVCKLDDVHRNIPSLPRRRSVETHFLRSA